MKHILLQSRSKKCCNYVLVSYPEVTAFQIDTQNQSPIRGFVSGTYTTHSSSSCHVLTMGCTPITRTRTSPKMLLRLFGVS
nr:MAG TPA: hypothetical protein [Caudoviricetes sp.]